MTTVEVDLRAPGNPERGASGYLDLRPLRRRTVSNHIVLPSPFTVPLVDGRATVELTPTDGTWCWVINEHVREGVRRNVVVPDVPLVGYEDLVDVDPSTLAPAAEPVAAWNLELGEVAERVTALELAPGGDGPAGPVGPEGPQGPAGPAGAKGDPGPMGEAGPQGEAGPAGADGDRGPQGETGPEGPVGPAGADGADGAPGATGPAGADLPAGTPGHVLAASDAGPVWRSLPDLLAETVVPDAPVATATMGMFPYGAISIKPATGYPVLSYKVNGKAVPVGPAGGASVSGFLFDPRISPSATVTAVGIFAEASAIPSGLPVSTPWDGAPLTLTYSADDGTAFLEGQTGVAAASLVLPQYLTVFPLDASGDLGGYSINGDTVLVFLDTASYPATNPDPNTWKWAEVPVVRV